MEDVYQYTYRALKATKVGTCIHHGNIRLSVPIEITC